MNTLLLYLGAILPIIWGVSHLLPTKNVVAGFGDITEDNRKIITMEWIIEGVSLIFIGFLVVMVTIISPVGLLSEFVYALSAAALLVLALVSFFTGFRINFLPFRMCPIVLTSAAVLIIVGMII